MKIDYTATTLAPEPIPDPRSASRPAMHGDNDRSLCFGPGGDIVYCSTSLAEMIGRDINRILGAAVTSVFPGLPVNGTTHDENVTAMETDYVNRCRPIGMILAGDRHLSVEASFRRISLGKRGPLFLVQIEAPREAIATDGAGNASAGRTRRRTQACTSPQ